MLPLSLTLSRATLSLRRPVIASGTGETHTTIPAPSRTHTEPSEPGTYIFCGTFIFLQVCNSSEVKWVAPDPLPHPRASLSNRRSTVSAQYWCNDRLISGMELKAQK